MTKPKILVTSAAGHTGSSAVFELLQKGFPVRAFVRRVDARSEALEKAGAEIAVGDVFDFRDLRKAMVVKYQDTPFKAFTKAAKALDFPPFDISQLRYYSEEIRNGAFEIGAPTDHVEAITGQKPESFESIARRYIATPSLIHAKLKKGGKLQAVSFVVRMMLARPTDFEQWERERAHPLLKDAVLAQDSPEWRETAENQLLNLLPG